MIYGWHHILKSAQGMWKFCVWLAFSHKSQEPVIKTWYYWGFVSPGVSWPVGVEVGSYGFLWLVNVLSVPGCLP